MSSNVQPFAWERYLRRCESLEHPPEAIVDMQTMQKFSEALYLHLCSKLGYESMIQIRRNITILADQVDNQGNPDNDTIVYNVGSRADGLRMAASDYDYMYVLRSNMVVNHTTEISEPSCAKSNITIITMETQHTTPGYVRLILETDKCKAIDIISNSCLNYNDKLYISSTKFRKFLKFLLGKNAKDHGPCATVNRGVVVQDHANCLSCTSQPTAVQKWELRCNEYNWPDSVVLKQCISLGCQLAPVGSQKSPHRNLEWRISFILMEKTLLQSLSHSQFMCYGLLKIYLKEVLGSFKEIHDLVPSYFMKTVLLWEIQTNSQHNVGADCLLRLFRNCLHRLHTCVKTEDFPNFFIPENNMFETRINGESKHILQNILELLFTERFYGLFRCQSIDLLTLISKFLIYQKQSVVVSVSESIYVTKEVIETLTYLEINVHFYSFHSTHSSLLRALELIRTKDSLTDLEKIAVQTWFSKASHYISIDDFKDIIAPNVSPDIVLEKYNSCCNIFRTHDFKGSVAPLYQATLMYITGRYHPCLNVIIDLSKRFKMLFKEGFVPMVYVTLNLQLTELRLELELALYRNLVHSTGYFLWIHPILYVSMLSVLCNYHLDDVEKTAITFKLLREMRSDMEYMKHVSNQEMYWQILGICAEIIGKYDEAYQSYVEAYKSPRFHLDDNAPLLRVLCLIYKRLQQ